MPQKGNRAPLHCLPQRPERPAQVWQRDLVPVPLGGSQSGMPPPAAFTLPHPPMTYTIALWLLNGSLFLIFLLALRLLWRALCRMELPQS